MIRFSTVENERARNLFLDVPDRCLLVILSFLVACSAEMQDGTFGSYVDAHGVAQRASPAWCARRSNSKAILVALGWRDEFAWDISGVA